MSSEARPYVLLFCVLPFVILATLNAGGYRYGASDQAFYLPVILANVDPDVYPRDRTLIASQGQLTTYDNVFGAIVRATGAPLPVVCAVAYVLSLLMIAGGTWIVAQSLLRTTWGALALLAAMTLRHAVARSGTNTLEGYFHPRQLVFGFGLLALGAFLKGRYALAAILIAAGATIHPTAALWFALWLYASWLLQRPQPMRLVVFTAVPAAIAAWALTLGPLAGHLMRMDAQWLAMLSEKNYLFPWEWPPHAWILNVGYLFVVALVYRWRRRAGLAAQHERALILGSCVLVFTFAAALVLQALKVALAFQLQPARLFLIFDFLATVYLIWALAEGVTPRARRALAAAILVVAVSATRGLYVILQDRRPLMQLTIPHDDWGKVMEWARTTDKRSHWLADPLHAALYGTSVRVAAERDVFVEAIKDAALGLYDRNVAQRTADRMQLVGQFLDLTTRDVVAIAPRYDLDYLIAERPFALPVVFESGPIRVYRLR